MAESQEARGRATGAALKLAAVVALLVIAVGVAVYSAVTALRGPKEVLEQLPSDAEYRRMYPELTGGEPPPAEAGPASGPAATPNAAPAAPADLGRTGR